MSGGNSAKENLQRRHHLEHTESRPWMGNQHYPAGPQTPRGLQGKDNSPTVHHIYQRTYMIAYPLSQTPRDGAEHSLTISRATDMFICLQETLKTD